MNARSQEEIRAHAEDYRRGVAAFAAHCDCERHYTGNIREMRKNR